MQLVNATYLWALLALAVPVAIHLLSRKEGQVIPVGSLRHLQETASQQFRGIKLNELLLLALRLLLFILFVMLLAGLFWNMKEKEKWVVVDSELKNNKQTIALADSLEARGYAWHWLSTNFPSKEQTPLPVNNYWQLMNALGELHLEHAVVLSANRMTDFKGKLTSLPSHIDWQTFELPDTTFAAYQIIHKNNVLVRNVVSASGQTSFNTDTLTSPTDGLYVPDSIQVAIVADKNFEEEARLIKASLAAMQTLPAQIVIAGQTKADWIIWLSEEEIPHTEAKILVATKITSGKLIEQVAPARWQLNNLSVENMVQQNATIKIAELITRNPTIEKSVDAVDRRMLSQPKFKEVTQAGIGMPAKNAFQIELFILFLLVWIAERTLAFIRKQ